MPVIEYKGVSGRNSTLFAAISCVAPGVYGKPSAGHPKGRGVALVCDGIAGLVLAAGLSSRMGDFKPLLPLGSSTVIERVIATLHRAGLTSIYVVVGYQGEKLSSVLAGSTISVVENPRYQEDMFSSVVAGVRALPPTCRGFLLWPADIPLVRPDTLQTLMHTFMAQGVGVVHPCHSGKRGHPPLISRRYVPQILGWSGAGGLRALWHQSPHDSLDVTVDDPGTVLDMDTPDDYLRMLELCMPTCAWGHTLGDHASHVPKEGAHASTTDPLQHL